MSILKNKSVFVTGCTGLLGSWLTKELLERGANVVGLVRDLVPSSNLYLSGIYNSINIVRGNLENYSLIERAINEYEIDTIFHLGAQTIVGTANRSPLSTFESNIKGSWNVLEAARNVKSVKRIIVASSDKAYGNQEKLPYDESAPLQGEHPYDVSKSCTDLIARTYYKSFNLPVCITRCGNLFGGGDLNFNRLIPGTIQSVLNNERPVIRSDGSYIRDYFYVKDAAKTYVNLAEQIIHKNLQGEAFNFSNEIRLNALELVMMIIKLMEREDLEPVILNEANNEIKYQYLSSKKAREILDWQPYYSFEEGLIETIEWYTKFFEMKNQKTREILSCHQLV